MKARPETHTDESEPSRTTDWKTWVVNGSLAALVLFSVLTVPVTAISNTDGSETARSSSSMSSEPAALIANNSSAFIIALEPDGSAQVSLRLVYDLTAEAERTGFERVKANASTFADAYATRLEPLAARASNETGREMSIRSPDAEFKTIHSGTTGVVELSATWTNIATERDGRVVLAEPFNDGFAPERPFVVNAPDGYELVSVAPNPNGETRSTVAWTDGQSLDGFAVEFEATGMANEETTPVTTSSSEMPVGAAPVLALLAVVSVVAVLVRKPE